ncbi:hypothetical protein HZH66_005557 [Vespula vulgaris]|uniref:Uncharacterized protein n=1 Tax=Vespula vulgaris TaxID=7454 RepID=A0A834K501_VESVU|nr:hypothetical protein HZH66_005557 [Vespula vulgaris]
MELKLFEGRLKKKELMLGVVAFVHDLQMANLQKKTRFVVYINGHNKLFLFVVAYTETIRHCIHREMAEI